MVIAMDVQEVGVEGGMVEMGEEEEVVVVVVTEEVEGVDAKGDGYEVAIYWYWKAWWL